jgi:hypothetical protein
MSILGGNTRLPINTVSQRGACSHGLQILTKARRSFHSLNFFHTCSIALVAAVLTAIRGLTNAIGSLTQSAAMRQPVRKPDGHSPLAWQHTSTSHMRSPNDIEICAQLAKCLSDDWSLICFVVIVSRSKKMNRATGLGDPATCTLCLKAREWLCGSKVPFNLTWETGLRLYLASLRA